MAGESALTAVALSGAGYGNSDDDGVASARSSNLTWSTNPFFKGAGDDRALGGAMNGGLDGDGAVDLSDDGNGVAKVLIDDVKRQHRVLPSQAAAVPQSSASALHRDAPSTAKARAGVLQQAVQKEQEDNAKLIADAIGKVRAAGARGWWSSL